MGRNGHRLFWLKPTPKMATCATPMWDCGKERMTDSTEYRNAINISMDEQIKVACYLSGIEVVKFFS